MLRPLLLLAVARGKSSKGQVPFVGLPLDRTEYSLTFVVLLVAGRATAGPGDGSPMLKMAEAFHCAWTVHILSLTLTGDGLNLDPEAQPLPYILLSP